MPLRPHNGLPIAWEMELRPRNGLPTALKMELCPRNGLPITLKMELRSRNRLLITLKMELRSRNRLPIALKMELRSRNRLPIALKMELRSRNRLPIALEMKFGRPNSIFNGFETVVSLREPTLLCQKAPIPQKNGTRKRSNPHVAVGRSHRRGLRRIVDIHFVAYKLLQASLRSDPQLQEIRPRWGRDRGEHRLPRVTLTRHPRLSMVGRLCRPSST